MLGNKKHDAQAPKVLDVDASLQGNLVFKDEVNLRINGNFEGRLETRGDLLIGERSAVKASIIGERITIAGHVTGDVTALVELRLTATAKLLGNISTPSFVVEKGGLFQGFSRMQADGEKETTVSGRKVFLSPDEVAHYLSVETNLISQWAESGRLPALRDGSSWRFEKEKVDEWIANGRIT